MLISAVVLFSLTACSGGNDDPSVWVLDSQDSRPQYLSFFSPTSLSESDVSKYWTDQFMKQYNKQVYVDFDGAAYYASEGLSYRELLVKRLKSSAPDDLYIINAEDVMEFEKKGYWMDLSDMDFVENLSELAYYQSIYNEKVFSVPLSVVGFGFIWNVEILKEHSLAIPENLSEFLHVCETLKSNGILPYGANKGFSLTVPAMSIGFAELYRSEDQEERIDLLNSGEMPVSAYLRDGFAFLSMMIEKGYMDPEQALASTPHAEDVELFLSGECAFICTQMGKIYDWAEKPFQMEMTGLPLLADGYNAVYGATQRLCVNPKSKNLDTALEFIEMIGTTQALQRSAELVNTMPSTKIWNAENYPMETRMASLLSQPGQVPNQDFALHFNTWESIRNVARELCSGIDIDQACAMLDEKQLANLKEYEM